MTTSKLGGALRSRTVLRVPRRRASSSESVTALTPPTKSESVGFIKQVFQRLSVGRADERHAALGDRPRGSGLGLGTDLVDDDDLGHMIFDGFDHHGVLQGRIGDLHAAR